MKFYVENQNSKVVDNYTKIVHSESFNITLLYIKSVNFDLLNRFFCEKEEEIHLLYLEKPCQVH